MIDSHIQKKDVPVYLTFLFVRLYFTHCNQRRGKKKFFSRVRYCPCAHKIGKVEGTRRKLLKSLPSFVSNG